MNTASKDRLWRKFLHEANNVDLLTQANTIRAQMVLTALEFGVMVKQPLTVNPESLAKIDQLNKANNRNHRLISGVEIKKLGLRFSADDFDILASQGLSADEIAEYQALGWIPIAIGVVILSSALMYMGFLTQENENLKAEYNKLLNTADSKFCALPNSATCQAWNQTKQTENFEQKKTAIEKLESGVSDFVDTIKKGAGVGIAVAIALIAFSYLGKK